MLYKTTIDPSALELLIRLLEQKRLSIDSLFILFEYK